MNLYFFDEHRLNIVSLHYRMVRKLEKGQQFQYQILNKEALVMDFRQFLLK